MGKIDYVRMRQDADKAIRDAGTSGVLRAAGAPTGDPWNPTPGEPIDTPVTVAVTEYSDRDKDGTLIKMTDKKALVSAEGLTFEIENADSLVISSDEYQVVTVDKIKPADVVVVYEIQVRK